MNWATPYDSATRCTGGPEQGARHLLAYLLETYDQSSSLGIYNCRTVRGGSTTSTHGEGRAVDLKVPYASDGTGGPLGHEAVRLLGEHGKRLGIQAVIFDRKIWSAKSPSGRYYGGSHPHYDHLHIELTREAADKLTLTTLRTVLGDKDMEKVSKPDWVPDEVLDDLVRWGVDDEVPTREPYVIWRMLVFQHRTIKAVLALTAESGNASGMSEEEIAQAMARRLRNG